MERSRVDDLKCREGGDWESIEELSRSWRDRFFFSYLPTSSSQSLASFFLLLREMN